MTLSRFLSLALITMTLSCSGGQAVSARVGAGPAASVEEPDASAPPGLDASTGKDDASPDSAPTVVATASEVTAAAEAGPGEGAVPPEEQVVEQEETWCPEGVETLPGPICAVVPDTVRDDPAPTLVIFLHGVTNVGSGWQLALIQGMARYAQHQRFALLAPQAPRHRSTADQAEVYAWRTAGLGPDGEEALLNGWMQAKAAIEQRTGHPFAQVFVMGFSSGAYYVSSLALRGRLAVDGYAAFAGGSAPYSRGAISHVSPRVPIFVGYGLKDRAGSRDARGLVAALRSARWKFREMAVRRAGHTITTSQFTAALAFLRGQSTGDAAPTSDTAAAPAAQPPPRKKRGNAPAARPPRKNSKRKKR